MDIQAEAEIARPIQDHAASPDLVSGVQIHIHTLALFHGTFGLRFGVFGNSSLLVVGSA
jgi:hypothetical protein